jgi:hypothetical protein
MNEFDMILFYNHGRALDRRARVVRGRPQAVSQDAVAQARGKQGLK